MIDKVGSCAARSGLCVSRSLHIMISCRLALLAIGGWFMPLGAGQPASSDAFAAEVDAASAPAPVGFASIVERVKPAVVGVSVKIEGANTLGDTSQKVPFPFGSPLDRFFRQFGIPNPNDSIPDVETGLGPIC